MKTLVIYDSVHGNTGLIAQAIGEAIPGDVQVLRPAQVDASQMEALDLLVVGAPTHGGRPTDPIQDWLGGIQSPELEGVNVAAFDTRLTVKWVRIFGYAAPRIAANLEEKGGTLTGPPGDFFVNSTKGPLIDGEVERAAEWARQLIATEQDSQPVRER